VQALPEALVGAGTVLTPAAVRDVHAAGGRMIVAPNFDAAVVRESVRLGMVSLPGVMSPTEAFAALAAGAAALKLFPAEAIGPAVVKALRAVLDPTVRVLPVGGITPANIADYRAAGASGFGIGSSLYKPGMTVAQVAVQARRWVDTWRARKGFLHSREYGRNLPTSPRVVDRWLIASASAKVGVSLSYGEKR